MSKLFCIRMSVSIETPKAFSTRRAISGESADRSFKSAESARRQGGLGLGLQLARSIVGIHGGSIEVEANVGGGIVFRVWLPVHQDRASIRARASKPSWESGH